VKVVERQMDLKGEKCEKIDRCGAKMKGERNREGR